MVDEKNVKYLENQLLNTGFGEIPRENLWQALEEGKDSFQLTLNKKYGEVAAHARLHFAKGKESDLYFFNKYELIVNAPGKEAKQQTYYVQRPEEVKKESQDQNAKKEYVNSTITLKEGFNMLHEETFVRKDFLNEAKEKYTAFIHLDFTDRDKYNNYPIRKKEDYDLNEKLSQYPIKELGDPDEMKKITRSLERGNPRVPVTMVIDGKEEKMYVNIAPRHKSVDFYDSKMKPFRFTQNLKEENGQSAVKDQKNAQSQDAGQAAEDKGPRHNRTRVKH